MALRYFTGFEHGVIAGGPNFNLNALWDYSTGSVSSSTAQKVTGSRSLYIDGSAANAVVRKGFFYGGSGSSLGGQVMVQFYVRHDTALADTNGERRYIDIHDDDFQMIVGAGFRSTDSGATTNWYVYASPDFGSTSTLVSSTETMSADTWYRVVLSADTDQNPWNIKLAVDGTEVINTSPAYAAQSDFGFLRLGNFGGAWGRAKWWLDDIAVWDSISPWVPDPVNTYGYAITSNGTHNLDASTSVYFFQHDGATPTAITTAETTSYTRIDQIPMSGSSDRVYVTNDAGAPAATYYLEYEHATSSLGVAPEGVHIIEGLYQETTASASMIGSRITDNGGVSTTASPWTGLSNLTPADTEVFRDWMTTTKPSGGSFTEDAFNATKIRWGYTSDADPDVRLTALFVEALFPQAGGQTFSLPWEIQSAPPPTLGTTPNTATISRVWIQSREPTHGDDTNSAISVGDVWIYDQRIFWCVSAASGAAVWKEVTSA